MRIEEMVSGDDVAGGAGGFKDADFGFGDRVVHNDVIVVGEKNAGLGAAVGHRDRVEPAPGAELGGRGQDPLLTAGVADPRPRTVPLRGRGPLP